MMETRNNLLNFHFLSLIVFVIIIQMCVSTNNETHSHQETDHTDENEYPLHECVFNDDVKKLSALLPLHDVTKKDKHGNTALHLAIMMGKKECIQLLLAHKAPVEVNNLSEWSVLSEAISYGDRETVTLVLRKSKEEQRKKVAERRSALAATLKEIPDFYMEMRWEMRSWDGDQKAHPAFQFSQWIWKQDVVASSISIKRMSDDDFDLPFLSRLFPSDVCKIQKHGSSVRFDYTIVDFREKNWQRGDVTFLFIGEALLEESTVFLDNRLRVYQKANYEKSDSEIENETDKLMANGLTSTKVSTESLKFTTAECGRIFKADKKGIEGPYSPNCFSVDGIVLKIRERSEHLSANDAQKNKADENLVESIIPGNSKIARRISLEPPPPCSIEWEAYIESEPGQHPNLGRPIVIKEQNKNFKANVAMSPNFPLTSDMLLGVLEAIEQCNVLTSELRKFIQMKLLPPGVPVKLEIPVLPTVYAKITFQNFKPLENVNENDFQIPSDYREDPERFSL